MEQDTNKLIEEQFKALPPALQRAITLMPWRNLVAEVAASNNLSPEQAKSLETESMLIMYGFESEDDFGANLMRELSVDESQAKLLIGSIEEKVFSPVMAKATELQAAEGEETLQNSPETAPASEEIAPQVVVEASKSATPASAPINLISPAPEEKKLEAPKLETSSSSLAPTSLPTAKPANIIEEKVSQVTVSSAKSAYPGGQDPYREPIK